MQNTHPRLASEWITSKTNANGPPFAPQSQKCQKAGTRLVQPNSVKRSLLAERADADLWKNKELKPSSKCMLFQIPLSCMPITSDMLARCQYQKHFEGPSSESLLLQHNNYYAAVVARPHRPASCMVRMVG